MNKSDSGEPSSTPPASSLAAKGDFVALNDAYQRIIAEQQQHLVTEEAAFRQLDSARRAREAEKTINGASVHPIVSTSPRLFTQVGVVCQQLRSSLRRHPRLFLIGVAGVCIIGGYVALAVISLPQTVHISFAKQQNCTLSPTLFPVLLHYRSPVVFAVSHPGTISLGRVAIFSATLCVKPRSGPEPGTDYSERQTFQVLGLRLSKDVRVVTATYPAVTALNLTPAKSRALPLIRPLQFRLATADEVFTYAISANHRLSLCAKNGVSLLCSLAPLDLRYDVRYRISLVREFHRRVMNQALATDVQTINATGIMRASIAANATVYNVPGQITLQTNKPLFHVAGLTLSYLSGKQTVPVPVTSTFKGTTITISIAHPLPRQSMFTLHIANVTAVDRSQLEQAYSLSFATSGGPAVTTDSLPSYGVASGQPITLTFNQPLLPSQNIANLVSLQVNGAPALATYSLLDDQIRIQPTSAYPVCATITVRVSNAVQSNYGITGNSAYSFASRSHCYTTFSVGNSVEGRPITGYKFGNGPSQVLYMGAMEGNEQNASKLLAQWISDIDANPAKIPSYRTVVVIPTVNPDGYAADTRLNADGVDLNRNFPAKNWQQQVTEPLANAVVTNDGGPHPLSEPESQALATYYQANRPRLTLTMHSHGAIVEANDAGDSTTLGAEYAKLAGYRAVPTSAIGSFFDYSTTGAFEDWAHDQLSLPVLEVELESPTNVEYSRNLPALWAMAEVSP